MIHPISEKTVGRGLTKGAQRGNGKCESIDVYKEDCLGVDVFPLCLSLILSLPLYIYIYI